MLDVILHVSNNPNKVCKTQNYDNRAKITFVEKSILLELPSLNHQDLQPGPKMNFSAK